MIDRTYINAWLRGEEQYQFEKWGDAHDEGLSLEEWEAHIVMYMHRASVLGLDTINGRQAIAKATATANAMLASTVHNFGPLPVPGKSSGESLEVFEG